MKSKKKVVGKQFCETCHLLCHLLLPCLVRHEASHLGDERKDVDAKHLHLGRLKAGHVERFLLRHFYLE